MNHISSNLSRALVVLALALTTGCGGAPSGPQKFTLSGSVTFNKKPVPKGFITFSPDDTAGNKGPGGGAAIVNGTYRTEVGKGIVGGAHVVKIVGYDGVAVTVEGEQLPDGKSLFAPYSTSVNFPMQNTTHDFDVPSETAP